MLPGKAEVGLNEATLPPHMDKCGSALNAQRFHMLEDIAEELSGDIVFPTCFDVVMHLRQVLKVPSHTMDQIATLINLEPLISAKLLRIANSAAYNPGGHPTRDLKSAINRMGLNVVRTVAMGIAMKQLLLMKNMVDFEKMTREVWEQSIYTASAAQVIARRLSKVNPDEAMLAGLAHNLGTFYMIYRAAQYEELRIRPDTVKHLVLQWHESIGHSLLNAIGLPEDIVEAISDQYQLRTLPGAPRNLCDVVYVAKQLAYGLLARLDHGGDIPLAARLSIGDPYQALEDEIQTCAKEMKTNFS